MSHAGDAYRIVCPSCGTVNRVPGAREGERGKCGQCAALLPPLHLRPVPLTDRDFDSFVRNFPGPVLVEFWAPW
jgi:thioredoxin 2